MQISLQEQSTSYTYQLTNCTKQDEGKVPEHVMIPVVSYTYDEIRVAA